MVTSREIFLATRIYNVGEETMFPHHEISFYFKKPENISSLILRTELAQLKNGKYFCVH